MFIPKKDTLVTAIDKERLNRAQCITYTKTDHGDCSAYLYEPPKTYSSQKRPVIIFFHGGIFDTRMPSQFSPHCLHFASRGMLAFSIEYRVSTINGTAAPEAMEDARSFLRYLYQNLDYFKADADNIVVAGSTGGAFLASHLCSRHKHNAALVEGLPRPVANILYSPLVNTTEKGVGSDMFPDKKNAKISSPSEQVEKNYPPTIIFHGKQDELIPYAHSEKYAKMLKRKKNHAELLNFETGRHIDFHQNVNPQFHEITLRATDNLLTGLGIIAPDPDAFLD